MLEQAQNRPHWRSTGVAFDAVEPVGFFASAESFLELVSRGISQSEARWHMRPSEGLHRPWIYVTRRDMKPRFQGWKLHITATVHDAPEVLRRSIEVLTVSNCSFKIAGSLVLLDRLNAGGGGATQVGKFITAYPEDDVEAVRLAVALDAATLGLSGPAVPSDQPISHGSLVSYRFGAFGEDLIQTPTGEMLPALLTPEGQFIPDRRMINFNPPEWAEDPFVGAGIVCPTPSEDRVRLIADQYLPLAKLYSSPRGDVLLATDFVRARLCVIKSAHPHAAIGPDGRDAHDRLRYEADVLARLAPLAPIPKPVELFHENDELYLVMDDMGGETLEARVLALTSKGRLPEPEQVLEWGQQLADMLLIVHSAGFVYGDLKSINVLEKADGGLSLVDLEAAHDVATERVTSITGTRGYLSPKRDGQEISTVDDDVYGFGALLYFLATGAEPSLAARPEQLLSRPIELLNPRIARPLSQIISRCLAPPRAAERFRGVAEVSAALKAVVAPAADPPAYGEERTPPSLQPDPDTWLEMASRLGDTICQAALPAPGGSLGWASTHPAGAGLRTRDVNTGNAGTVLALAELVGIDRHYQYREVLLRGTRWLRTMPRPKGRPLTGLYVGEGGVAVALLRAGQVLGSSDLLNEAGRRGRWIATHPFHGPDLMNGAAGRLRTQLLLWDELGDDAHLRDAIAAGEWLLAHAECLKDGIRWRITEGFNSLSGHAMLGYAHGAAGIGDALLDLADSVGDDRFMATAQGAMSWLEASAQPSATTGGLDWPDVEGGGVSAPFWCRGATGIGRFFLNGASHGVSGAIDIAEAAARSVAGGARWASPTQCHGLAGNIEFLLDLYQATQNPSHYIEAAKLARILDGWSVCRNSLLSWPSENGATSSPDYMVGYAGVLACLLRLSDPDRRPHQLTRSGFRFRPAQSDGTTHSRRSGARDQEEGGAYTGDHQSSTTRLERTERKLQPTVGDKR